LAKEQVLKSVRFDIDGGAVFLGDSTTPVEPGMLLSRFPAELGSLSDDAKASTANVAMVTLDGQFLLADSLCRIMLVFKSGRVWSVQFRIDRQRSGDWPTQEEIDSEITTFSRIFADEFGPGDPGSHSDPPFKPSGYVKEFPWGSVETSFDPRGFQAYCGLVYK
jgi:hypothetical protein